MSSEYLLVIAIRDSTIESLDERDQEFIQTLRNLDVSKNLATTIAFLGNVAEATSREIELGANLSQPGVSKAMKALQELGWLEARKIKVTEGGRPRTIYALKVSLEGIVKHFEEEKLHESAQDMEAIQRLKERISC